MLRDHFHPPLRGSRHWESFHSLWAGMIATDLNRKLPPDWYAEPTVHFGIEIDVTSWNPTGEPGGATAPDGAEPAWSPAPPTMTLDFPMATDCVQVDVYENSGGPVLAGAIELVSPANKDRRSSRDAFLTKCEALLLDGIGLIVIDIVTNRLANLHLELLRRLGEPNGSGRGQLSAASYHPTGRDEQPVLEIWHQSLDVGQPLPEMPLFLKHGPCVQVNLSASYQQTCEQLRLN